MSFKMKGTEEVFGALDSLCSDTYRMYDTMHDMHVYELECDMFERCVRDAAHEYRRLLGHCEHQRDELAALTRRLLARVDGEEDMVLLEAPSRFEQGTSITGELRKALEACAQPVAGPGGAQEIHGNLYWLLSIADSIDGAHARAVEEAYASGHEHGLGESIGASDVEREHVKLPVDADGIPIRPGDRLEFQTDYEGTVYRMEVGAVCWDGSAWSVDDECGSYNPALCRHAKPDSWERIVEDAMGWDADGWERTRADAVKELVERCERLAG